MKKIYLLLIFVIGCSKQVTCTKDDDVITIVEKNNSIEKIEIQTNFKNEEESNNYCTLLKLSEIKVKCQKNSIIYENYKDYFGQTFTNPNDLFEFLENDNYNCK